MTDRTKAKLSISRPTYADGRDKMAISIYDTDAGVTFVSLEIDLADFTKAITGEYQVPCEMAVNDLDRVGKKVERDNIEFPLPNADLYNSTDEAKRTIADHLSDGWICHDSFSSQNSIVSKDGVYWARAHIRRWVDKDKETE